MSEFSIRAAWMPGEQGPAEIRSTGAWLHIAVNDRVLTRVDDAWAQTVRDEVLVSAYPLALWLAASWWRLSWEPEPAGEVSAGWQMAHHLAAAGHGFLWPRLVFVSDGETVEVRSIRTEPVPTEPLRYLEDRSESISPVAFARQIDEFLDLVLARLEATGLKHTELHALWREIRDERTDDDAQLYRQLEARLGFDPDEAPEAAVRAFQQLSSGAGEAAIAEIAPACSGPDPASKLAAVIELAAADGIQAHFRPLDDGVAPVSEHPLPWERGWELARLARRHWQLGTDPVSNKTLSEILGVTAKELQQSEHMPGVPLGLAVRDAGGDRFGLHFRRKQLTGRRFEAVRFLADNLVAPSGDRWLPATDAKTARQKVQRAFAAEFLCPIDGLRDFLEGDLSDESLENAGERFGVSPLAVRSHLANHGLLPRFDSPGPGAVL